MQRGTTCAVALLLSMALLAGSQALDLHMVSFKLFSSLHVHPVMGCPIFVCRWRATHLSENVLGVPHNPLMRLGGLHGSQHRSIGSALC